MTGRKKISYFKNYTRSKGLLYSFAIIYVFSCSLVSLFAPLLVDCPQEREEKSEFENPGYTFINECHHRRQKNLLYLTPLECAFGRRITFAVIFGALIGWERRQADRPAGIRTMSLVSLGSCLFSICGTFAFISGPMGWDASRVSAAIPSGVGFLGAGIIWKQTDKETNSQSVHGLTTAASLWLSAAVGIACAGGLYFAASFAIATMMILLRFGPRIIVGDENNDFSSDDDDDEDYDLYQTEISIPQHVVTTAEEYKYNSIDIENNDLSLRSPTTASSARNTTRRYKKMSMSRIASVPSLRE